MMSTSIIKEIPHGLFLERLTGKQGCILAALRTLYPSFKIKIKTKTRPRTITIESDYQQHLYELDQYFDAMIVILSQKKNYKTVYNFWQHGTSGTWRFARLAGNIYDFPYRLEKAPELRRYTPPLDFTALTWMRADSRVTRALYIHSNLNEIDQCGTNGFTFELSFGEFRFSVLNKKLQKVPLTFADIQGLKRGDGKDIKITFNDELNDKKLQDILEKLGEDYPINTAIKWETIKAEVCNLNTGKIMTIGFESVDANRSEHEEVEFTLNEWSCGLEKRDVFDFYNPTCDFRIQIQKTMSSDEAYQVGEMLTFVGRDLRFNNDPSIPQPIRNSYEIRKITRGHYWNTIIDEQYSIVLEQEENCAPKLKIRDLGATQNLSKSFLEILDYVDSKLGTRVFNPTADADGYKEKLKEKIMTFLIGKCPSCDTAVQLDRDAPLGHHNCDVCCARMCNYCLKHLRMDNTEDNDEEHVCFYKKYENVYAARQAHKRIGLNSMIRNKDATFCLTVLNEILDGHNVSASDRSSQ